MNKLKLKNYLECIILLFIISTSQNGNGLQFDEIKTLNDHNREIYSVAWSPNGKEFVTGSGNGTISIYTSNGSKKELSINGHDTYEVRTVSWSPNGSLIASGSCDNTIKIWDAMTGSNLRKINAHSQCVNSIKWSPNGLQFASGNSNNITSIWNSSTFNIITNLTGNIEGIWNIDWCPNGSLLATGTEKIRIWNTTTWQNIITLNESNARFIGVWSPDGKLFASENSRLEISIWETKNWKNIKNLTLSQPAVINSISWSPDSSFLASGSSDKLVRIWSPNVYTPLNILAGHAGEVTSVDWSSDGERILSGSYDNTVKIWGEPITQVHLVSLVSDKTELTYGDTVNLTATIINEGKRDCSNILITFYDSTTILKTSIMNISHGTSLTVEHSWHTNKETRLGSHFIHVTLNEEEKNITIIVKGIPNVFIKKLTVDKNQVIIGKSVIFSIVLENNGTADAENISVSLFDTDYLIDAKNISIKEDENSTVSVQWNTSGKKLGSHTFKTLVGNQSKEISITVNPRINTSIVSFPIFFIILFLLILISIIYLKNRLKTPD
jgi:WD40 repeat protein